MGYIPREYQVEAVDAGISFFNDRKKKGNGLLICPTGSGKSLIIALIAGKLPGKTIIFQPSKEILRQNFEKYLSYGFRAAMYSASGGMKHIDRVTFATIGSVAKKHHLFHDVENIIVDEAHCVNPEDGMYHAFIKAIEKINPKVKVLGLTATPYRLSSGYEGAMLRFLNRTSPRIFNRVLYFIQNGLLFDQGFLAPLEYFHFDIINRKMLETNSSGTDFTDASLKAYYRMIDMPKITTEYANRLLKKRRNLLVFCSLIEEARKVTAGIPGAEMVTGETEPAVRDRMLSMFKAGRIPCIVNVGVLTTGFDFPGLEAVLIARSTMSLALYYQIIGRVMRPFTYADGSKKVGWVIDLGNNVKFFGKIETMKIEQTEKGLYYITNNGRQLTNINFSKE